MVTMPTLSPLKDDPQRLHQAAQILERENRHLIEENLSLKARVDALEGRAPASLPLQLQALEQPLSAR